MIVVILGRLVLTWKECLYYSPILGFSEAMSQFEQIFGDMDWDSIHNNLYFFPNLSVFSIIQVILRLEGCIWSRICLCRTSFFLGMCVACGPHTQASLPRWTNDRAHVMGADLWQLRVDVLQGSQRVACYESTLMWSEKDGSSYSCNVLPVWDTVCHPSWRCIHIT